MNPSIEHKCFRLYSVRPQNPSSEYSPVHEIHYATSHCLQATRTKVHTSGYHQNFNCGLMTKLSQSDSYIELKCVKEVSGMKSEL